MSELDLEPGEEVLLEAQCLSKPGVLAHNGTATLTGRRLHFQPRKLDRLAGGRDWTVDLLDVGKLQRRGVDQVLEFSAGGEAYRLMGDGTRPLEAAVRKAIQALEQAPPAPVTLAPGESVVAHGAFDLVGPDRKELPGELSATTHRLVFSPAGRHKFAVPSLALDLPLGRVVDARLHDGGKGLLVSTPDARLEFTGPAAGQLFARLVARPAPAAAPAAGEFRTFPATLSANGAAYPGQLAIVRDALVYGPDGAAPGSPPLRIPTAQVVAGAMLGIAGDRMLVHTGAEAWEFTLEAMDTRFRELVQLIAEVPSATELPAAPRGRLVPEQLANVLATFRSVLPFNAPDVALAGTGVIARWPELARRGWLIVARGAAWLVPSAGLLPGETLAPIQASDFEGPTADGTGLVFRVGPDCVEFIPLSDEFGADARDTLIAAAGGNRMRNRRASYRAPPPGRFPIRLAPVATPDAPPARWIPARLGDLSAEGCQLVTDLPLAETQQHVLLEVPVGKATLRLAASIVNVAAPSGFTPSWRYGVRFGQRTQSDDRQLRELWMRFQREETARRRSK